MRYVLGSNVAVKWVVAEPDTPQALQLRDDYRLAVHELLAPAGSWRRENAMHKILLGVMLGLYLGIVMACGSALISGRILFKDEAAHAAATRSFPLTQGVWTGLGALIGLCDYLVNRKR